MKENVKADACVRGRKDKDFIKQVRELTMDVSKEFVTLNGLVSFKTLQKLNGIFDSDSICFFVGYSEYEIAKGTIFSKAYDGNGKFIGDVEAEINGITQEFNARWDSIPKGWKTICSIKFNKGLPVVENNLDKVYDWFISKRKVLLFRDN